MKFLCENCKAKYQIGDEKVAGKSVRMKCRKCGHEIVVTASMALPEPTGTTAAAPAVTATSPATVAPEPPPPEAPAAPAKAEAEDDATSIMAYSPGALRSAIAGATAPSAPPARPASSAAP